MRLSILALLVSLVVALPLSAHAQDARLELRDPDSIKSILERHVGRRVGLVMGAGPELTGTVVKVGERVVHLGEMQGREFFDVAVSLERINAVVVRVRSR